MDVRIERHHPRTQKAQYRRMLDKFWRIALTTLAAALIICGVFLVLFAIPIGWTIASLAVVPAMIVLWWKGELVELAVSAESASINDTLSGDLLGQIHEGMTPKEIVSIASRTNSGLFFGVRYGLTPNLLIEIASDDPSRTTELLQKADELRDVIDSDELTAGCIVVATLASLDLHESLLAQLHIDMNDVLEGLRWQQRLSLLIKQHQAPRRTGGIARDWSFGYTPLLSRFGQNISQQVAGGNLLNVELDSHQQALNHVIDIFGGNGNRNAVIVGPTGVGKTMLVQAFAEKLLDAKSSIPGELKFRQVVMLDASSLVSAARGRGELEDLVMRILSEAFAAKNIIICLDNAQVFFEEGVGSVDIAAVLLPVLEAGRLPMILTMDEQRYLQISQRNPGLTNALNRVSIQPATESETLRVMQDQLISLEFRRDVTYTYQSLKEAYRLSSRYVYDIAMPGQALKLLDSAAGYSENGLVTINSVQQAIEKTLDIKVSVASESSDREALLNLEELIHKRMINQKRAVEVVSDALRRARAGVRNENRPIGTFLFLGPTGVGKTELAKALADVYFGGEDRLVRLDLNEYVRNEDVARLIADGSTDASSLTAQVMKQPYSVVLLDEIEKAHPSVLTTLLQLLDEGILRDINNREISFRDSIVIATSNAGADRIREYIQRGYKLEQFEDQFTDELISSGQFKPEFLNRFDEIVTFTPLAKADLLKIVDLMIAGVNKTLAAQKITVEVEDRAKQILVDRGYDPRLGARPMRRVIQRVVENNVAKAILAGVVGAGGVVSISASQVEDNFARSDQAHSISTQD